MAQEPSPPRAAAGASGPGVVQLVWRPAYACGNALIDQQHQDLFVHANALLAAMLADKPVAEIAACIDRLIAQVVEHFRDEEAILAEAGFADFESHAVLHRQLTDRAAELANLFQQEKLGLGELFQFLANDVVARHMLVEDRKFFPLFASA